MRTLKSTLLAATLLCAALVCILLLACDKPTNVSGIREDLRIGVFYSGFVDSTGKSILCIGEDSEAIRPAAALVSIDLDTGNARPRLQASEPDNHSCIFSKHYLPGHFLVPGELFSPELMGDVVLWDADNKLRIMVYLGSGGILNSIHVDEDAKLLAAGYEDGTVCIWREPNEEAIFHNRLFFGPVHVCATKHGVFASGIGMAGYALVNKINHDQGSIVTIAEGEIPATSIVSCGNKLYLVNFTSNIWVYDLTTNQLHKLKLNFADIQNLRLNKIIVDCRQERLFVSGISSGDDGKNYPLIGYDINGGHIVGILWEHRSPIVAIDMLPGSTKTVSIADQGEVIVWDAESGLVNIILGRFR